MSGYTLMLCPSPECERLLQELDDSVRCLFPTMPPLSSCANKSVWFCATLKDIIIVIRGTSQKFEFTLPCNPELPTPADHEKYQSVLWARRSFYDAIKVIEAIAQKYSLAGDGVKLRRALFILDEDSVAEITMDAVLQVNGE